MCVCVCTHACSSQCYNIEVICPLIIVIEFINAACFLAPIRQTIIWFAGGLIIIFIVVTKYIHTHTHKYISLLGFLKNLLWYIVYPFSRLICFSINGILLIFFFPPPFSGAIQVLGKFRMPLYLTGSLLINQKQVQIHGVQ